MTNIFFNFLLFPNLRNGWLNRITIGTLLFYLIFTANFLLSSETVATGILFFDGTILINQTNQLFLSFIIFLVLSILLVSILVQVRSEYYLIILTNVIGLEFLQEGYDWMITIIAWELLNISQYQLISMNSSHEKSLSVAQKYFLLSALTTSFLFLAQTGIYGSMGSLHYDIIYMIESTQGTFQWPFYFILFTLAFKIGAAPQHNWAPDLYDNQKTFITMWMTIIPKVSLLFFLLSQSTFIDSNFSMIIGAISLIVGSIALGAQINIKRFQAYSSISHIGFLFQSLNTNHVFTIYQIVYSITIQAIFTIIQILNHNLNTDLLMIKDLAGIFRQNLGQSQAFQICMQSLAGIPPQAGFYTKQLVFNNLQNEGYYIYAIIGIQTSVISAGNYQSLIRGQMFDQPRYTMNQRVDLFISQFQIFLVGGIQFFQFNISNFQDLVIGL